MFVVCFGVNFGEGNFGNNGIFVKGVIIYVVIEGLVIVGKMIGVIGYNFFVLGGLYCNVEIGFIGVIK